MFLSQLRRRYQQDVSLNNKNCIVLDRSYPEAIKSSRTIDQRTLICSCNYCNAYNEVAVCCPNVDCVWELPVYGAKLFS